MKKLSALSALLLTIVCIAPQVYAAGKIEIDDTKWISLGLGLRASFFAQQDAAPNGTSWSKNFNLNNLRFYVNGQIHEKLRIEFNTECTDCVGANQGGTASSQGGTMIVLDAVGKFEFNDYFNIWGGRLLAPQHRAEMDGPFYQNIYTFNPMPFYTQDFGNFRGQSGQFGRDEGVNLWGAATSNKRLSYLGGVFKGLAGRSNQEDNLLWAARVTYNFLELEKNPGYYTSSTYFGKGGDILALAYVIQYQDDGAGTASFPSNQLGMSADLLFEKVLGNNGVMTLEGQFTYFNPNLRSGALAAGVVDQATGSSTCFCLFDGHAWFATGMYLFPDQVGWGQFQPYARYYESNPDNSTYRNMVEGGFNYVIDGFNARLSLFYQYGDFLSKGRTWLPTVTGNAVSAVGLGLQLQL